MLSETIIHECITKLLKSMSDEESLECCAILITEVGRDLDHPEAKVCCLSLSLSLNLSFCSITITSQTSDMMSSRAELQCICI